MRFLLKNPTKELKLKHELISKSCGEDAKEYF